MDALAKDDPDLLITDVRLQGYNGLQLIAMSPRQIPTIVVTGYPDRMLEADAHKMGAEYLVKPVSPSALLALIRQKLGSDEAAAFSPARRWARKPVTSQLKAWFEDLPVRILDISYGGLRLEIDRFADYPRFDWPAYTEGLARVREGLETLLRVTRSSRLSGLDEGLQAQAEQAERIRARAARCRAAGLRRAIDMRRELARHADGQVADRLLAAVRSEEHTSELQSH